MPKQSKFDIVKFKPIQEPSLPEDWDYKDSLKRLRKLGKEVFAKKGEIVNELFLAWRVLHLSPAEAAKMKYKKGEGETWENFCKELNVTQQTVYNWFSKAKLPYKVESAGSRAGAGRKPKQDNNKLFTAINRFRDKSKGKGKDKIPFFDGQIMKSEDMDIRIGDIDEGEEVIIYNKKMTPKIAKVAKFLCCAENGFVVFSGVNADSFIKEIGDFGQVFRRC
jgi:hypothetical protein